MTEHYLTTFVRTKGVFKNRLNDLKDYDYVKLYVYELDRLGCNKGPLLWHLKNIGEIDYDKKGYFKALKPGPIDPSLLDAAKKPKRESMPLSPLHRWMREQLRHVELVDVKAKEIPVYFQAFLDTRDRHLHNFFSVDAFSNRVHNPVVNLKGELRFKLRLYGSPLASLDVHQMQPTILGKILYDAIGKNSFSSAISKGEDIYVHIQNEANLPQRKDAKKLFFEMIFGKPKDDIGKMFTGNTEWVDWINKYKSREEPQNSHKRKQHTNLAWLLQYSEVQVMTGIWTQLMMKNIPFLTIHDEILCRKMDVGKAYSIMREELSNHFSFFKVNVTAP